MTEPAHIELPEAAHAPRQWRPGRAFIASAATIAAILAGVAAVYAHHNAATTDAIRHDLDARTAPAGRHTIVFQANTGARNAFIVDATGLHDQQPVGRAVPAAGVVLVEVVAVSTGQAASCSISVDGQVVDREQAQGGRAAFTICLWQPGGVSRPG